MLSYHKLPGSIDVSVVIRIVDSTDGTPETGVVFNTSGIALEYQREGAASTAITEVTLAALTTAHTDGGFLHRGNGYYRLDLPDAAVATGVNGVLIHGTVTGMVVLGCYIHLDYVPATVYSWTGIDLLTGQGRLPGLGCEIGTLQAVTDTDTVRIAAAAAHADDVLISQTYVQESGTGVGQARMVASNALTNDVVNFAAAMTATLGVGRYALYASPPGVRDSALVSLSTMINGTPAFTATALALAPNSAATDYNLVHTGTASAGSTSTVGSTALNTTNSPGGYIGKVVEITSGTIVNYRGHITAESLGASPPNITFSPPAPIAVSTNTFRILKAASVQLSGITHTGAVIPTVTTLTGHTAQTGDAFARLGAPAGASVSADIAAFRNDFSTRTPAALISGRADAYVGAMAANVMTAAASAADLVSEFQSAATLALNAYDPPSRTELTTDINSVLAKLPVSLTTDGNMKSDVLFVDGINLQTNGSGTQNIGGP